MLLPPFSEEKERIWNIILFVYLGENFPSQYRGKLLMCNIHHHNMYVDRLEPRGSGLVGDHYAELMNSGDPYFLGFNLRMGHDGGVYIIDWYDAKECHGQTLAGKETGRIYKITYGPSAAKPIDIASDDSLTLAKMQLEENEWLVEHARRLLAERAAAGEDLQDARSFLRTVLTGEMPSGRTLTTRNRLRAAWALHVTGGLSASETDAMLTSEEPYLRGWAIQLALEDGKAAPDLLSRLARLAVDDPSPVVRLYLASALQRLPLDDRWEIAKGLVAHAEDADDHNLPLMYWYGIEPLVPHDRVKSLALAKEAKIPLLRQFIARRATAK